MNLEVVLEYHDEEWVVQCGGVLGSARVHGVDSGLDVAPDQVVFSI
jgi:hypothetical protein